MSSFNGEAGAEELHSEKLRRIRDMLYPKQLVVLKGTRDLQDPRNDPRLDRQWKWMDDASAEKYREILQTIWDGFVFDLRRGRYLELKRISGALQQRLKECEKKYFPASHVEDVIYFRRQILENVLWEHEAFGIAPYFDSLDAGSKRKVVASAVSDDVQQFIVMVTDPEMRHDYIGDKIFPECDNWNEKFNLYEEKCNGAGLPAGHEARYSSPESMKASYNKKLRQSQE